MNADVRGPVRRQLPAAHSSGAGGASLLPGHHNLCLWTSCPQYLDYPSFLTGVVYAYDGKDRLGLVLWCRAARATAGGPQKAGPIRVRVACRCW